MKSNKTLLLTIICSLFIVLVPNIGFSIPVGGLSQSLEKGNFTLGANVGYLTRDVDNSAEDKITSRQFILKGMYGVSPRVTGIFNIGLTDLETDIIEYEATLDLTYGGGIRVLVVGSEEDNINLTLDGQVLYQETSDEDTDASFLEYQGTLLITYKSENVFPYGGIKYNWIDLSFDPGEDFEAEVKIGIVIGIDYFVNPNVYFYSEMHNFDQDKIFFGVGYKF